MGCSHSKLDDEEAVQICKDRKRFIKQAIEHRTKFASSHISYIQSLRKVSDALHDFIQGDNEFLPPPPTHQDSFLTPVKTRPSRRRSSGEFITISPSSMPPQMIQAKPRSNVKANYLMANRTRPVRVEQRSPETFRVETFSPSNHQYGEADGFFGMNMNMNTSASSSSSFWNPLSSPEQRLSSHNIPPPSPQNSQWDFFWNPFSSLDYYGYSYDRGSVDNRSGIDDEIRGLRRVREEEGIPELEEDDEVNEPEPVRFQNHNQKVTEESSSSSRGKVDKSCCNEEVKVEDVDENDDDDDDDDEDEDEDEDEEFTDSKCESEDEKCVGATQEQRKVEVLSRGEATGTVTGVGKVEEMKNVVNVVKRETPGFTVYVNRRPTSMAEVIKDLEDQFTTICDAAKEVSGLLEASRAQYTSSSNDHSAMKMLNPVALFRSGSSRSSSSRFLITSSGGSRESGSESRSDVSDEYCMISGSHQTTLDRLFAWEKKLYDEVKSGERIRRAYEKKCMQLRNQDVKGDDPFAVDKTRATIRDLDTQIKVSIHSIESISKRIETLRDQELLPQLLELVQGLTRMWQVMAESHQIQKRTLDEAKLLLAGTPVSKRHKKRQPSIMPEAINSQRLAQSALNLEAQLRHWKACFEFWITSQRSYMKALSGWLLRCFRCDPDPEKVRLSSCPHPIYRICIQWSRLLTSLNEKPVLDKLEFFASGMGSIYARQVREDPNWSGSGSRRYSGSESMDLVVADSKVEEEVVMTAEKLAEVAVKVLCHGMSVAVSSLAEFAINSADEHSKLVNQPEDTTPEQPPDVNANS